ncbi:MAG: PilZ domain-containing protein [Syntrophaceae bacterium]
MVKAISSVKDFRRTVKVVYPDNKTATNKKIQPVFVDFTPPNPTIQLNAQALEIDSSSHDATDIFTKSLNKSTKREIDPQIIISTLALKPTIKKKTLVNMINHLHFTGESITVHIQDETSRRMFLLEAKLGPYKDDKVAIWFGSADVFDAKRYTLLNMIIDNSRSLVLAPLIMESVSGDCITIRLPDMSYTYEKRAIRRHSCNGVSAHITQGQVHADGVIENFNQKGLSVRFNTLLPILDPNLPISLHLRRSDDIVLSAECQILRSDSSSANIIFAPSNNNYPRLEKRNHTNPRVKLTPAPQILFEHPLCQKTLHHELEDISASGFSVRIRDKESLIIPGMIIPQLTLQISEGIDLQCSAQVIHSRRSQPGFTDYGFYILDMALHDQRCLFDAVSKATDPHFNMTGRIDMGSLWELFFSSGFIYPDKFQMISQHRDKLKDTYRRLYEESKDIFTQLTYLDNGKVYAHVSVIKAYEGSWLIHHLAAKPMWGKQTGLKLINHLYNYVNCLYRLPSSSSGIHYQMFYFQPGNKFTDYFFGGFARQLKKPEICSLDDCAYMTFDINHAQSVLPDGWNIDYLQRDELDILQEYYASQGGGLMLSAFAFSRRVSERDNVGKVERVHINMNTHRIQESSIEEIYRNCGLMRKSAVYALKQNNVLKAALLVDQSDLGINMSELLNSVKVIVIDNSLPWYILEQALNTVSKVYDTDTVPVLVFPITYLKQQDIVYKKSYRLWVMDTHLDEHYLDILKERVKIKKMKFIAKYIKQSVLSYLSKFGLRI